MTREPFKLTSKVLADIDQWADAAPISGDVARALVARIRELEAAARELEATLDAVGLTAAARERAAAFDFRDGFLREVKEAVERALINHAVEDKERREMEDYK